MERGAVGQSLLGDNVHRHRGRRDQYRRLRISLLHQSDIRDDSRHGDGYRSRRVPRLHQPDQCDDPRRCDRLWDSGIQQLFRTKKRDIL